MTPIINSSFNKQLMSWEIIHLFLLHPSESVMKAMCHHQNFTGLQKHYPKKLNQEPCTICYTEKMEILPKGKKFDTTNLQPG